MEIWKIVPGHERLYEVSNTGLVKSIARVTEGADGKLTRRDGITLTQIPNSNGYYTVAIDGKRKTVHRLVASAFIENPDNKPCVNHIDGDKKNNKVENLEWVTYGENNSHAYAIGLKKRPYNNRYRARFTDDEVRAIRKDSRTSTAIAKELGVTDVCICNIKNGKTYKGVSDD